jgi:hypothetical protein
MTRIRWSCLGGVLLAAGVASCSSPNEPVLPDGRVVLRFQPAPAPSAAGAMGPASIAAAPDSVAVRVFRGGGAITLEGVKGAAVTGPEPIELSIPCIAETGKRVSVEVFEAGVMSHHGANTDVDVATGRTTSINIDAYPFTIDSLSVFPEVVPTGSSFALRWDSAAAAAWYRVQSSTTPDFAVIEWEQTVADTVLDTQRAPGTHYFRVVPITQFASGTPAGPEFGYVAGGSGALAVTGFNPGAAIPGETFTILGENLDYPGTRAWIGAHPLAIEAASWGALTVRLPRVATTNTVSVVSGAGWLGFDTSDNPFVAQRVAYVTDGGEFELQYIEMLMKYTDDFGYSGVVAVPVADLDWRDMDVFDTILVADDTGDFPANWGGGQPARAAVIAFTPANVMAIGKGGAVFLQLVGVTSAGHTTGADTDGDYYVPDGSARIFSTPHPVGGGSVNFCDKPALTTDFSISAKPVGANLYASTDCTRLITCTGPNNRWTLADFRFNNPGGTPVVYFFWGYTDDPKQLASPGLDCLGNVMNMLYLDRP